MSCEGFLLGEAKEAVSGPSSFSERTSLGATLKRRTEIIYQTACAFKPNLFIVDKEPLGLEGEIKSTLRRLNSVNIPCVLGLRDVLDDPEKLKWEWKQKNYDPVIDKMESEQKSRKRAEDREIEKLRQDIENKKGIFDPNWEWKQRNYEGLQQLRAIGLILLLSSIIVLIGYLFDL